MFFNKLNHYLYLWKGIKCATVLSFGIITLPYQAYGSSEQKAPPVAVTLPLPYGLDIAQSCASTITSTSLKYAKSKGWNVSVAVVDSSGRVITLSRMDHAHKASTDFALAKASSAALTKRSTKVFSDALIKGRQALLGFTDLHVHSAEGGEVLLQNKQIVGGIGVAGVTQTQDREIALVGVAAALDC